MPPAPPDDQEYLDPDEDAPSTEAEAENQQQIDEPDTTPDDSAPALVPGSQAGQLAKYFFELIGSPAQFKPQGIAWLKIARELYRQYPRVDLKAVAYWVVKEEADRYWQEFILRFDGDPLLRFQSKLPQILTKYEGAQRALKLRSTPNPEPTKEGRRGRQKTRTEINERENQRSCRARQTKTSW